MRPRTVIHPLHVERETVLEFSLRFRSGAQACPLHRGVSPWVMTVTGMRASVVSGLFMTRAMALNSTKDSAIPHVCSMQVAALLMP